MKYFLPTLFSIVTIYSIYLGLSEGNPHLCLFFYGVSVAVCVSIKPKLDDLHLVTLIFVVATGGIISFS